MAQYDKRRANGPEDTYLPVFDLSVHPSAPEGSVWVIDEHRLLTEPKLIPPSELALQTMALGVDLPSAERIDIRPIHVQPGIIPNASGSALLECGSTKIACAVYVRGRQYAGKAELNVNVDMSPFSRTVRCKPGKDAEAPGLAALVEQALLPSIRLELLPKSSIDVYVNVLDMDTTELGCVALAITAASAALAESGIEMYGLVTSAAACAIPSLPRDNACVQQWVVDPSRDEAAQASTHMLIATMPALDLYETAALSQVSEMLVAATGKLHGIAAQSLFLLAHGACT
ncbi:3'-5'-exoribonuclease [Malassezia vespertilionis]|uniref:3'-5'-exoribonuclease n=1 Tax=Malassezia vespertilionis TaxID=2020962 RepID=UPI0024B1DC21|nr:3'-5'-exoribonuclease [Malassezia vespertilionis]WFD04960.1 3'-5'-exoribonuclease [Malassezia vespertilionis]